MRQYQALNACIGFQLDVNFTHFVKAYIQVNEMCKIVKAVVYFFDLVAGDIQGGEVFEVGDVGRDLPDIVEGNPIDYKNSSWTRELDSTLKQLRQRGVDVR